MIAIICKDGRTVEVSGQFFQICNQKYSAFNPDQPINENKLDSNQMIALIKFFQIHKYSTDSAQCQQFISSRNLKDHIDEISFKYLESFGIKQFDLQKPQEVEHFNNLISQFYKENNQDNLIEPLFTFFTECQLDTFANIFSTVIACQFYKEVNSYLDIDKKKIQKFKEDNPDICEFSLSVTNEIFDFKIKQKIDEILEIKIKEQYGENINYQNGMQQQQIDEGYY